MSIVDRCAVASEDSILEPTWHFCSVRMGASLTQVQAYKKIGMLSHTERSFPKRRALHELRAACAGSLACVSWLRAAPTRTYREIFGVLRWIHIEPAALRHGRHLHTVLSSLGLFLVSTSLLAFLGLSPKGSIANRLHGGPEDLLFV